MRRRAKMIAQRRGLGLKIVWVTWKEQNLPGQANEEGCVGMCGCAIGEEVWPARVS